MREGRWDRLPDCPLAESPRATLGTGTASQIRRYLRWRQGGYEEYLSPVVTIRGCGELIPFSITLAKVFGLV
jgi:hypothetical protein